MKSFISRSVDETERIAARIASGLRPGDCIALSGEMGAGKTQFVRGIVKGLGGDPRSVSSPTFVLLNVYRSGRIPLFHIDAYRLSGPEDVGSLGFDELLEQGGVVVVEWPERIADSLPLTRRLISISATDFDQRRIEIET